MTPQPHAPTHLVASAFAGAGPLDPRPDRRLEARPRRAAASGRRRSLKRLPVAAALGASALLAPAADAQTGGWVSFNGATQATATTFTDNVGFIEFHEDADFDADYAVGTGRVFDGGAGVRLANGVGFGVAVSRFERLDPVSLDARIPHPFYFNRPRSLSGSEPDLTRLETAVHVEVRWFESESDTVELAVFGGPTLFNVRQDLVTAIGYDHAYPYDEASLASATTTSSSATAIGFHAGTDIGFFFSETVGLGALIRYSGGSVDLPGEDESMVRIDTGGFHIGGGLRLRF